MIGNRKLAAAGGEKMQIPDAERLVHLQFRRSAGSASCNVHLHSFERRHDEITVAGVREVVVFRSTAELLQRHHGDVPHTIVLDSKGKLYTELAVTAALEGLG